MPGTTYFPRGGSGAGRTFFPRGYSETPPGTSNETLFPRGQTGLVAGSISQPELSADGSSGLLQARFVDINSDTTIYSIFRDGGVFESNSAPDSWILDMSNLLPDRGQGQVPYLVVSEDGKSAQLKNPIDYYVYGTSSLRCVIAGRTAVESQTLTFRAPV